MISTVLINGEVSDGTIPITDSSVLRGDACFEVIKAYDGDMLALELHLDRLERSASALQIELPPRDSLGSWLEQIAQEVGTGAVRMVVTRGSSVPGVDGGPRVIIFGHEWSRGDGPVALLPVAAPWHSAGESWALAGAKITSYAPNQSATREAQANGFDDALLMGPDELVLEGPTFSVAWVVGETLETPGLDLGILDSITRRLVLQSADESNIDVKEGSWSLSRLADASEVMALSTIREVQPVRAVGSLSWGPGVVTKLLAEAFERLHN